MFTFRTYCLNNLTNYLKIVLIAACLSSTLARAQYYDDPPEPPVPGAVSKSDIVQFNFTLDGLDTRYTLQERIEQLGGKVASRLEQKFIDAGIAYPPNELAYVVFKDAKVLEVYAKGHNFNEWKFLHAYPVLKTSGELGPKLKEGDAQVPEGLYEANAFNPNSKYHVALHLNYPNDFDRMMAKKEGRRSLGGDIMIHGNEVSIGCLAMGDQTAEDLFILSALARASFTKILISPTDFRVNPNFSLPKKPQWVKNLYQEIQSHLTQFKRT